MTDVIKAYPLQWPTGWPRIQSFRRRDAQFNRHGKKLNIVEAIDRVVTELERMFPKLDRDDIVISTNRPTRLNGLPDASGSEPGDPGAAIYWRVKDKTRVIAVDQYYRVADNIAAVAATLDAMRAIERHGGAEILDRAFTGFTALPPPGASAPTDWWVILECKRSDSLDVIKAQYRRISSQAHPDKPTGSNERQAAVNAAWAAAQREKI